MGLGSKPESPTRPFSLHPMFPFLGGEMFPVSLCLKRALTSIEQPVCFHVISASQQTPCNRFLSPTRFSQVQEVESNDVIKGECRPQEVRSFHLSENHCFLVPKIIYAHNNRLKWNRKAENNLTSHQETAISPVMIAVWCNRTWMHTTNQLYMKWSHSACQLVTVFHKM